MKRASSSPPHFGFDTLSGLDTLCAVAAPDTSGQTKPSAAPHNYFRLSTPGPDKLPEPSRQSHEIAGLSTGEVARTLLISPSFILLLFLVFFFFFLFFFFFFFSCINTQTHVVLSKPSRHMPVIASAFHVVVVDTLEETFTGCLAPPP